MYHSFTRKNLSHLTLPGSAGTSIVLLLHCDKPAQCYLGIRRHIFFDGQSYKWTDNFLQQADSLLSQKYMCEVKTRRPKMAGQVTINETKRHKRVCSSVHMRVSSAKCLLSPICKERRDVPLDVDSVP